MFKHLFMRAPDAGAGDGGGSNSAGGDSADNGTSDNGTQANDPTLSADEVKADFLKGLGFDNVDDLQAVIKAQQDAEAANHTDLENAKSNLDKATSKLSKETARADDAEAQLAAYKQGVAADHIVDALTLARASLAAKADGVKTIDEALVKVLERNPAFKGESTGTNPDGTSVVDDDITGNQAPGKNDIRKQVEELNKFRLIH